MVGAGDLTGVRAELGSLKLSGVLLLSSENWAGIHGSPQQPWEGDDYSHFVHLIWSFRIKKVIQGHIVCERWS